MVGTKADASVKPLEPIVVLDLTHVLSGPYCTMLLADLGARIIKVEPPCGESTRKLFADDPKNSLHGMGAYFLTLNRNKESICIDLKSEAGLALFYELVKRADVVVNNLAPGVPTRLKIDHERLSAINPRIITCSITGFGETGPFPDRPAFDQVAQGMSGGMSITGLPGGQPLRAGIPIGDLGGGIFAAIGILTALEARHQTGRGQHVDISMLDVQISLLNYMATMFFLSGENPGPLGNGHFLHVPYNTYPTKDRWLIIAVIADATWRNLVEALGIEELHNPEFLTQPGRWKHRDFINEVIASAVANETCDVWLERLTLHRVPCAPVNDFEHALNDPQIRSRNMVVRVAHPQGGSVEMPGNPVKLSDMAVESFMPPPLLGQDTSSVLRVLLGKSDDDISSLRRMGAIN